MSDQRDGGIAWCDETWNPIRGCSRVDDDCGKGRSPAGCYAEAVACRFSGPGLAYEGLVRISSKTGKAAGWNGEVRLVGERLADPIRWGRPRRIFVNSMSDLFHEKLDRSTIAAVLGVICMTGHHTHLVLTKRADRMRELLSSITVDEALHSLARVETPVPGFSRRQGLAIAQSMRDQGRDPNWEGTLCTPPWAWFGVSCGSQRSADVRIPDLLRTPAAVRWVSQEPQHGPIEYRTEWLGRGHCPEHDFESGFCSSDCPSLVPGLDWIVLGGESGPDARFYDLAWPRRTLAQCREHNVAAFMKQFGVFTHDTEASGRWASGVTFRGGTHGDMGAWPEEFRVRQFPGGAS